MEYILDFETSFNKELQRANVWLWTSATVEEQPTTYYGTALKGLYDFMSYKKKSTFFFHNLSFDGLFILSDLLERGFSQTFEKTPRTGEFKCTFMNNTMYSIEFKWRGEKILIKDSYKIIPVSVEAMPKIFGLASDVKGVIDYDKQRDVGYTPSAAEIKYGLEDVIIVAKSLNYMRKHDMPKYTTASNALYHCKKLVPNFKKWFPILETDFIKEYYGAYVGGLSFVNNRYKDLTVGNGIVLDVNSEYPYIMRDMPLPYGPPVNYKTDCFFIKIKCQLYPKEKCPDFLMNGRFFELHKAGEIVNLCLTSVDYNNMHKYYYVKNEIIIEKVYFNSKVGILSDYINYWGKVKIQSEMEENMGMRYIAKLMLNSLYGKFGAKWYNEQSHFTLDENGILKNIGDEEFDNNTIYMPYAAFVTAWGRDLLLTAIYELMNQDNDNFLYCDTDSIHMLGNKIPSCICIHKTELGAWKDEFYFTKARYIHSKCYVEMNNNEYLIKCCGLPKKTVINVNNTNERVDITSLIPFDAFVRGAVFKDIKLRKQNVKGGCVLIKSDFTIR